MAKDTFRKNIEAVAKRWWVGLKISTKTTYKRKYERLYNTDNKKYPNMKDTNGTRISKLTDNQIYCIWRFKDH